MARKNENTDVYGMLEVMASGRVLRGKEICVTGHLGVPRHQFANLIDRCGGRLVSTPTSGTFCLVTNHDWTARTARSGASLKLIKARRNGVQIMKEPEFYSWMASLLETSINA